jgi:multidrug efflux pump
MQQEEKTRVFETLSVPRAVAQLAVPTILSSLVMVLYNLADTFFVGLMNNPVQNAAVTLAAPVLLAFNAVNNLFGVGSSSMISRALGRRDEQTAKKSAAFGFYAALACGALFALLCTVFRTPLLHLLGTDEQTMQATASYLRWTVSFGAIPAILNVVMAYMVRAEGAALHASIGTMSGCLLNIILDPIFILPWGFNMGAEGAALATFLSNCVACCYFFVLLYARRRSTCVSLNPRRLSLQKAIVLGVCAVGVPASIQNLLNVTGMTVLNNFASSYGADAVAAMGIAQKINTVPFYIALGLSQGIMPLVSYNYASGNYRRMKDVFTFALRFALCFMLIIAASYYVFAGNLVRMFMNNADVVANGTRFLRGFCLGLPFLCVDFLAVGVFQALGKGREALFFAVLRKIVLEIPALYLLNRAFPLYGLVYAQPIAETIMVITAVTVLLSIFRKLNVSDGRLLHRRHDG